MPSSSDINLEDLLALQNIVTRCLGEIAKAQNSVGFNFEMLITDLQKDVLSFCDITEHGQMAQASKKTQALIERSPLWHELCTKDYPQTAKPVDIAWKSHFQQWHVNNILRYIGNFPIVLRRLTGVTYPLSINLLILNY